MGLFSKAKKFLHKSAPDPFGAFKDKKKQQAVNDPDPINPLTGRPRSQDLAQDPFAGQSVGLGQMPSYQPPPVSAEQRVPQGLGGNVFRSTLAPLQQQGYGLGQIDPRLLTSTVRFPGGSTMPQAAPPAQPQAAAVNQIEQLRMLGGLGRLGNIRKGFLQ